MDELDVWKALCSEKQHAYFVKSIENICQTAEHSLVLVNDAEQVVHIYIYDKQIVVNAPRPLHFFQDAYSSKDVAVFVQHLWEFHHISTFLDPTSTLVVGAQYLLRKRLDPSEEMISSRL